MAAKKPKQKQKQKKKPKHLPTHGLNDRQRRVVEFVAAGMKRHEAYVKAGYKPKTKRLAGVGAWKILSTEKGQAYLQELQAAQQQASLLTLDEKRLILAEYIRREDGNDLDRDHPLAQVTVTNGEEFSEERITFPSPLKVIEMDSKLAGHFAPDDEENKPAENPVTKLMIEIRNRSGNPVEMAAQA